MTQLSEHLDDETLSTLVDEQLSPDAAGAARAHVESCPECQARLEGFRSVAGLLRKLPEVTLPRDFWLGPRLVADPPNVVRLRRWYTATRTAAATLAAMFVLLSAGTLYVDSQRASSTQLSSAARPAVAPASDAARSGGAAPAPATVGVRAAAQPAVSAPSPAAGVAAPGPAAPAAAKPVPRTTNANPQADDQQAASTTVSSLPPTPAPIALPTPAPARASAAPAMPPPDPAAPLRTAAVGVGLLAVLALLIALVVRHRLRRTPSSS